MKKVLINVEEREVRIAILEDEQLIELYIESLDEKNILSNIYKGRIEGVIPGLKAAFVNIGMERNAFLHFDDFRPDLLIAKKAALEGTTPQAIAQAIAPPATPGFPTQGEYQPDEEENAETEASSAEAAPGQMVGPEEQGSGIAIGAEQQAGESNRDFQRRRRRGRRGGRRRKGEFEAGSGSGQSPQVAGGERPPFVAQPQQHGGSQHHQRPNRPPHQHRDRNQRHDRNRDRQPRYSPPEPGNQAIWVPQPGARDAAPGTRAAANPYDVFSPYSQPPGPKKKWRRDRKGGGHLPTPSSGFETNPGNRESQEDFFPPPSRAEVARHHEEDDAQPRFDAPAPEQDFFNDEGDAPAPGNERFPTARPQGQRQGGRNKNRRGRQMRRRGPSGYAAKAKPVRPAKEKAAKSPAPKGKAKAPAKVAKATASKIKKAPAKKETISAKAPVAEKAPARKKKIDAVTTATTEKKTRRTKAKEVLAPPAVAATPAVEAPRTAEPTEAPGRARGQRGGRRGRIKESPAQEKTQSQNVESPQPAEPTASASPVPESPVIEDAQGQPPAPPVTQSQQPHHQQPGRRFDKRPQHQHQRTRPRWPMVTEVFKKGDEIMVQVIKEEIGTKGARISSYVSVPGRYLVLLPYQNEEGGGVSRKVEDHQERKRLKRILHDISSPEMAFIVRTAGIDRGEEDIRNDVEYLKQEWATIAERYEKVEPTQLVYDDHNILYRLARDVFDDSITEILIDSPSEAENLKEILGKLIPSLVDKVQLYSDAENIFHRFQVQKQIQKAARRKVWLKSGGYLIIDEAEALTAIDVNTGKFVGKDDQEKMILKTNLEAGRQIARELKLRDIGGLIVIDFIDMKDQRNRDQVLNEFRAHLKRDRSKTSVSGISEFGLVEMTRKRVRQSLRKTLFMDCPYCQGAGVVLNEQQIWLHVKHEIVRILEAPSPPSNITIVLNPKIRAYVEQNYREALNKLEQKYNLQISVSMSEAFHVENYAIERSAASEWRGAPAPSLSSAQ